MYETVKIVKGHSIERMVGTHGRYHVKVRENVYRYFKTIKSAVEFIETELAV